MNYNLLYYFKVLGETEHFGQAAKILHIEQPSLSQSMKRLEKELGLALFEKRGRNVHLSEHGRAFHNKISEAFESIERAALDLQRHAQLETIVVSSVHSHPRSPFSRYVTQFLNHPDNQHIRISIFERHSPESFAVLKDNQCDLIVCSHKNNDPDLVYIPLAKFQVILLVPYDHPLAVYDAIDVRDTLAYKYIYPCEITGMRAIFERVFREVGQLPPSALEAESVSFTASLVADNFGIALSPEYEHLHLYQVKKIRLLNQSRTFYHYLAYSKSRPLPPAAEKFRDFLTELSVAVLEDGSSTTSTDLA